MGKDIRLPLLLLLVAMASGSTGASASREGEADKDVISWEAVTSRIEANGAEDRRLQAAIETWRSLAASDRPTFAAVSAFLVENPGWPDETKLTGLAEKAVDPATDSPSAIVAYFAKFPPRTAQGGAAYATALALLGRTEAANAAARDAWVMGSLPVDKEADFLARFSPALRPADHLRHADAALWRRDTGSAERVLDRLPVTRQAVIAARIAFQRKADDAALKMGAADPVGVMDAGYLADKARWLAATGQADAARDLLARRPALGQTASDPEEWYEALLAQARAAAAAGDWANAYTIAARVDDAFPPNTDVSTKAYGVRDDYTSLVWLAGTVAFNQLGRPADAQGMFQRYADGGRSPSTTSKGLYWAGRAALAAGRKETARDFFTGAGAYSDQYYGQLALERLGKPIPAPDAGERQVALNDAARAAFGKQPLVRAAQLLGAQGAWADQTKFVRAIAASAETPADHLLAEELSRTLGRPDLGVMVGRRATASGLTGYDRASFPRMKVPQAEQANWTMIHAIARQESQFDRAIVSYAGARGLMQLMPATAREQAGKNGVAYDSGSLFDPDYNIQLGSAYFRRMLAYYNGSYPLAVAAYNAGMGNVNKWLKANGDPRQPGGDIVQWIESIPIYQTKDYVQRVLENAVVYDLVNPMNDGPAPAAPLSRYLGKSDPG